MSDDGAPKSALELAMERLRRKDREAGQADTPLTDAQKAAIAEARNLCEARLAEREILHRAQVGRTPDPEAVEALEEEYRRDRDRLARERDEKIAAIRKG